MHFRNSSSLVVVVLIAGMMHVACSSTTEGTSSGAPSDAPSDARSSPSSDAGKPESDGGGTSDGKIGTLTDKGVSVVNVDISSKSSWTCDSVCKAKGASCSAGGNGAGQVSRKYNDGSGTTSNRISSCDENESYISFNTTMTGMSCYCDGLPVPPTVRVKKSEGLHACKDVCASWSLVCAADRKSYAYTDEEEKGQSTVVPCATVPAATTHHYVCACAAAK